MDKESGVVLVTGAVGNLGRVVAAAFAARGRRLALLDRDAGQLAAAFGADDASRVTLGSAVRPGRGDRVSVLQPGAPHSRGEHSGVGVELRDLSLRA